MTEPQTEGPYKTGDRIQVAPLNVSGGYEWYWELTTGKDVIRANATYAAGHAAALDEVNEAAEEHYANYDQLRFIKASEKTYDDDPPDLWWRWGVGTGGRRTFAEALLSVAKQSEGEGA